MKKEELLDLITELKVDDRFIEEALSDDLDERAPVKAYAGNTKRSPMRIIAPIAACLAVIVGAGFVLKNMGSPNIEPITPASEWDGLASAETSNTESEENSAAESSYVGYSFLDLTTFPSQNNEFVDKCKNIVLSQFGELFPDGATWTWQVEDEDFDLDGYNELVLCPWVNHRSVKGVGVCVFKRGRNDAAIYLGSFGGEFTTMDIENFYIFKNEDTKDFLYFNNNDEDGKCIDSIQRLFFNKDTNTLQEENYLRLVKDYSNGQYTETAYRYGIKISPEELLNEWNSHQTELRDSLQFLPLPNVSGAHNAAAECVQLLVDKYEVPFTDGSPASLHRTVRTFDINGDGEDETVIEFRHCEQLPGVYVFSSDGRLIGEIDLEGERGELYVSTYITRRYYTGICKYENGDESYYYYRSNHSEERTGNGWARVSKWAINKIVVNADGTLSSKVIMEDGAEFIDDTGLAYRDICQVNGEDVTLSGYTKEERKYPGTDYTFIW